MHCLNCGYDLRGLPENRCPECGRAFDPGNPATFAPAQRAVQQPWRVAGVLATIAVVVLTVVGFFAIAGNGPSFNSWLLAGWIFLVGLLASMMGACRANMTASAVMTSLFVGAVFGPSCAPQYWAIFLAILVANIALLFGGFHAGRGIRAICCPH
jgi:hypothetical protein